MIELLHLLFTFIVLCYNMKISKGDNMATTKKKSTKSNFKKQVIKNQVAEQDRITITAQSFNKDEEYKKILANEYFNGVKSKGQELIDEKLKKELEYLPNQIEELLSLGQTSLANKLKKQIVDLTKERILLANGFDTFINRKDVTRYIDLVKDKKVHICELDKFPRLIPESAKNLLLKAKSLNIFQDFWVVYVDYTGDNESMLTEEEKKQRKKNRDPIIFGTFDKPETSTLDKLYFICDWTDEYCDLTLDKMVSKLVEDDKNYKPSKIVKDVNKYINNVLMENQEKQKTTFTNKVKKFFGIK